VPQQHVTQKLALRLGECELFAGVPQGTLADVISADPAGSAKPPFGEAVEVFDVAIQWRLLLPKPSAELVTTGAGDSYIEIHWFTKDEYEKYLEEVESQPSGAAWSQ
jgi:hypothetical protein